MRHAALALFLIPALLLVACGGKSYQKEGAAEEQAQVALQNCRWEATHEKQADGGYVEVDVDDDAIRDYVEKCMREKGYEYRKDTGGGGWWPF
jgi:major membrane immunogen (membrane-anchored lipoprotein)